MTQANDALTYLLFSAELQSRTQPANREQALRKIALIQALAGQPSSLSALDRELKLGPIVEGEDEDTSTSRARRDRLPGGVGDSLPDEDFDPDQLAIGIRHEMEHTDDEELAKEIAKDHLAEDPDYYTKLAQIEESWDESKHPRDHGKFAKKEGGPTLADKMPGGKASHPQPSKTILQRAIQIAVSSSPAAIAAKHIARQAGFSERTATILSVVASVGDWSIPGVPAGSSAVIVGALLKRPTVAIAASQEMMRKARSLVREVALSVVGSFRESEEEKIVDEEALLAIGEWLESVDDQEWATAVLAAAMEEADGNLEKALTIAEQVMKFGSQLAEAEEDEDTMERAEAIAELLLSVYGEDALDMFEDDEDKSESKVLESLLEAWNPDAHPRGANGRFIKKNSPEAVAATKGAIKDSLRKPRSGDTFQELMEHLNILTTKQIRELSKEYGVSAGGRVKAELVEKIAKRLDVGRRGENEDLSQEEFPTYDEWAKGEREKRKKKEDPQEQSPVVAQEAPLTQVWTKKGKFDFVRKNNDGTVVYLDDSGKEQTTDPNERYTLVNPSTVKPLPPEKDYSNVTVRTMDGEFPVVKKHSDGTVSYKDKDGTVRQTNPDDRIFVNDPDAAEYNRKLKRMEREEKAASAKKQKEIDAQRPNVKAVPPTKSVGELSRLADQQFVAMKASGNPVNVSGADRLKALAGDVASGKKINPDQLLDILTQYARPESPTMPEAIDTLNELARHVMSSMSKDELQDMVEKADREAEMGGTGVPGAIAELKADLPPSGQDSPQEGDRNAGLENSSQKDLAASTIGDAINTGDEKQPVSSGGIQ